MEFDNVHDEVADLRARVERLEGLLAAGTERAKTEMQSQAEAQRAMAAAYAEHLAKQASEETADGESTVGDDTQNGDVPRQE